PYRPTIGGACGMYRPPIGPVSAIERAIVCMRMPGLADLRQPNSRGFLHTATSGGAPRFFYARCAERKMQRAVGRTRSPRLLARAPLGSRRELGLIPFGGCAYEKRLIIQAS